MAEKLQVKTDDFVHLRGESGSFYTAVVLASDADRLDVLITGDGNFGLVQLRWDNNLYRSIPNNKPVQVDQPVLVRARLKKLKTDDGIMELLEENCWIGKEYMVDIMSIHDMEWQHLEHPGESWTRPSAYVYSEQDESDRAMMPVEFFDIEYV